MTGQVKDAITEQTGSIDEQTGSIDEQTVEIVKQTEKIQESIEVASDTRDSTKEIEDSNKKISESLDYTSEYEAKVSDIFDSINNLYGGDGGDGESSNGFDLYMTGIEGGYNYFVDIFKDSMLSIFGIFKSLLPIPSNSCSLGTLKVFDASFDLSLVACPIAEVVRFVLGWFFLLLSTWSSITILITGFVPSPQK